MTVRDELQARALFQQRYGNRPSRTARRIGLRVAADRAAAEGLAARVGVVVAAASGLPFCAGSFDAVIHTDVLC